MIAIKYAMVTNTLFMAAFYNNIIPACNLFSIAILNVIYWFDKNNMRKKYSIRHNQGPEL